MLFYMINQKKKILEILFLKYYIKNRALVYALKTKNYQNVHALMRLITLIYPLKRALKLF